MAVALKLEDFTRIMNRIKMNQECSSDIDKLFVKYKINRDFIDLFGLFTMNEELVIDLLETIFADNESIISWWIYECNWGKDAEISDDTIDDGKIIKLDTVEKLYNYLAKESKSGQSCR